SLVRREPRSRRVARGRANVRARSIATGGAILRKRVRFQPRNLVFRARPCRRKADPRAVFLKSRQAAAAGMSDPGIRIDRDAARRWKAGLVALGPGDLSEVALRLVDGPAEDRETR